MNSHINITTDKLIAVKSSMLGKAKILNYV